MKQKEIKFIELIIRLQVNISNSITSTLSQTPACPPEVNYYPEFCVSFFSLKKV